MAQQLPLVEDLDRSMTPAGPRSGGTGRAAGRGRKATASRRATAPSPRSRRAVAPAAEALAGPARRARRALAVVASHPDVLVEVPGADWRIDEHTKKVGLAGVAEARRALATARGRSAA